MEEQGILNFSTYNINQFSRHNRSKFIYYRDLCSIKVERDLI